MNFEASPNGKRKNGQADQGAFDPALGLALNNPLGTFWPDYVQTAALEISPGEDAEVGGADNITIIASGDGITLDAGYTWTNVGSDEIDTTDTAINELLFLKKSETEIIYTCKIL